MAANTSHKKGFTIVELVIVITVIAILAAVLIPTFSNIVAKAQQSSDRQMLRNINEAIALEAPNSTLDFYSCIYLAEMAGYSFDELMSTRSGETVYFNKNSSRFYLSSDTDIPEDAELIDFSQDDVLAKEYIDSYDTFIKNNFAKQPTDKVDIILFAGQSNMCGRATSTDTGFSEFVEQVSIDKAFTFNNGSSNVPVAIEEPLSCNGSSGYGMVPAFLNEYYNTTGRKVCACFMSSGGQSLRSFTKYKLDDSTGDYTDTLNVFYQNMTSRVNDAKTKLAANGYTIGNIFLVWCQGENEGSYLGADIGTYTSAYEHTITSFEAKAEYYYHYYSDLISNLKSDIGLDKAFLVRIGHQKNNQTKNTPIIEAQNRLGKYNDDVVLVSTFFAGANSYTDELGTRNLMRSDNYHYLPEGYVRAGHQAGMNTGLYLLSGEKPYLFDYECYIRDDLTSSTFADYVYNPYDYNLDFKIESLSLSAQNITIELNEAYEIAFDVEPLYANKSRVIFRTDNDNVCTVANGKITAVGVGTTEIEVSTADNPAISAQIKVSVVDTHLGPISLDFEHYSIADYASNRTLSVNQSSHINEITLNDGIQFSDTALPNGAKLVNKIILTNDFTVSFSLKLFDYATSGSTNENSYRNFMVLSGRDEESFAHAHATACSSPTIFCTGDNNNASLGTLNLRLTEGKATASTIAGYFLFDGTYHEYTITYKNGQIKAYRDSALIGSRTYSATPSGYFQYIFGAHQGYPYAKYYHMQTGMSAKSLSVINN